MRIFSAIFLAAAAVCAFAPLSWADEALFLPVDEVYAPEGWDIYITGQVVAGTVRVGDTVDIVAGGYPTVQATVTGIQQNLRDDLEVAEAGDEAKFMLSGVDETKVRRGHVIVAPGVDVKRGKITATVTAYDNLIPLPADTDGRVKIWNASILSHIVMAEPLEPGQTASAEISFTEVDAPVRVGDTFTLKIQTTDVASGVVVSVED